MYYYPRGGSSFGTEDISMAEQTREQREANYIHFGLIIVSLRDHESVRTRLRQALRTRGEDNHGALARRILLSYHRDIQHEEQSELRTLRDEMMPMPAHMLSHADTAPPNLCALESMGGAYSLQSSVHSERPRSADENHKWRKPFVQDIPAHTFIRYNRAILGRRFEA